MVLQGLLFWLPSFLERAHGLAIIERAVIFGGTTAVAGVMGNWISGWIMDKWGSNRRLYVLLPTWAGLTAIPIYAIGLSVSTLWIAVLFIFLGTILTFSFSTPTYAAVQHLVRSEEHTSHIHSLMPYSYA